MAKRKDAKPSAKPTATAGRSVERAIGPAADEFGKAVAPLGERAGKLTRYVGEKREAMELWADHIDRLVMPEGVKALR